jgi:hypothetical protein
MSECQCYTSHNLNTNKDEHTLSRSCPVHQKEAQAYYAELDAKVARTSGARHDLESVRSIAERTNLAQEIGFAGEIEGVSDQAMLARAWRIAIEVHALQLDKNQQSYLFHVARVAMAMDTPIEQVCGLLHDVIEDSPNAGLWLRTIQLEFPPEVLACCKALTRAEGEDYMDYIRRVSESPLATKVKLADLRSNMEPERLMMLPHDEMCRLLTRYGQAVKLLVMSKGKR